MTDRPATGPEPRPNGKPPRRFQCPDCPEWFWSRADVTRHRDGIHGEDAAPRTAAERLYAHLCEAYTARDLAAVLKDYDAALAEAAQGAAAPRWANEGDDPRLDPRLAAPPVCPECFHPFATVPHNHAGRVYQAAQGAAAPPDLVIAALTDEDEIAHGEAYEPVSKRLMGVCAYCDGDWPCRTQRGIDRLLARLSGAPTDSTEETA